MTASGRLGTLPQEWESLLRGMKVVRLSTPLAILVPALAVPALPKSARGFTLFPGRAGLALGVLLVMSSAAVGYLLYGPDGPLGTVIPIWLIGTTGVAMFASALRPTAFVKPTCAACRLLPVIKEHEAIHLSGIASEKEVWESMKARHSVQNLSLEGDPGICYFCPIPKRLSEH